MEEIKDWHSDVVPPPLFWRGGREVRLEMHKLKRQIIKLMPGLPLFWRGNEGEASYVYN
jgi:hypothetical protein